MPMKPLKQFVLILFAIVFVGAIGVNSGCSSGSSSGTDNPNQDSDQDGINNGNDPDADGDGIPNNGDQDNPPPPIADSGKACTTTKIYWPNDEIVAGNNADIRWELLPKGCGLSSTQNKAVKAIGSSGNVSVASVAKYPGQLITSIRVPCDPQFGSAKRPVRYDFTELGRMLGDSQGGYQATISHPGSSKGCSGGDGNSGGGDGSNPTQCSDFSGTSGGTYPNCTCSNGNYVFDGGACVPQNSGGGNQCPTENGAGGTYPSCSCASGYNYNASTNTCDLEFGVSPGSCTGKEPELFDTGSFALNTAISSWFNDKDATIRKYGHISCWNVSNVTSFQYAFSGKSSFNEDLNRWNTGNVKTMYQMFYNASSFNKPISAWNTSRLTDMRYLFYGAKAFNQDIGNWNTANVSHMDYVFWGADSFNRSISKWNVSKAIYMPAMFRDAASFNQDLSQWCVSGKRYVGNFDLGASSWSLPRPVWGTCPRGEDGQ